MPMFRCFAWVYRVGPPEFMDSLVPATIIFAATRPLAITKFVDGEVIPANNDHPDGPYDLAEIDIGVDVVPTVPNWQP